MPSNGKCVGVFAVRSTPNESEWVSSILLQRINIIFIGVVIRLCPERILIALSSYTQQLKHKRSRFITVNGGVIMDFILCTHESEASKESTERVQLHCWNMA